MKRIAILCMSLACIASTPRLACATSLTSAERADLDRLYRAEIAIGANQAAMLAAIHQDLLEYAPRYFKAADVPALRDSGNTETNVSRIFDATDFLLTSWGPRARSSSAKYEIASQLTGDTQPQVQAQNYLDNVASPLGDPISVLGFGYGVSPDKTSVVVRAVLEKSAAESAGIRVGDRIVAIGGVPVTTDLSSIGTAIRASELPNITFAHDGVSHDVALARTIVKSPTVFAHVVDGIAVVRLSGIGAQTASDFASVMAGAPFANASGLVLDLRGTRSGTYDEALAFVSAFVPERTLLGTRQRGTSVTNLYAAAGTRRAPAPLVLLVGYRTAGSVEFIAAAMRKFSRAKIVGEYTRNMPFAVRRFAFEDGSGTLLADGGLYLPGDRGETDGPDRADRALKPDVLLEEPTSGAILESADPARDAQLQAALAIAH